MPRITKNTLLNYIPNNLPRLENIDKRRVFDFNKNKIKKGKIIYLCQREIRIRENTALDFAQKISKELKLPFKVIHQKQTFLHKPKELFVDRQIKSAIAEFLQNDIEFETFTGTNAELVQHLKDIQTGALIIDFNPIQNYSYLLSVPFKIFEVDGHNIVPARLLSDKQEFGASTIRKKIYFNICNYLYLPDETFKPVNDADFTLVNFIKNDLPYYFEFKNDPAKNISSGLSKYLNLGFISVNRVVYEVLCSNVSKENKEAFFEELIVRKELAENFCLYCKDFKTMKCTPKWASESLAFHKNDLRQYIYSLDTLEKARTHDILWNAAQTELLTQGTIHGYLRMYWAKKISEWTSSAQTAVKYAIYLNDKYAYDSPSPNGYCGILWAIAALHDRAFRDSVITGKIRRMTYNSMRKKFDIEKYINKIKG